MKTTKEKLEPERIDACAEVARHYASRWRVAKWHAYLWVLEQALDEKFKLMKVAS